jgi:hypothetical protein
MLAASRSERDLSFRTPSIRHQRNRNLVGPDKQG